MPPDFKHDLARTVLAVLFLFGLIAASIWILRPFLAAIIWATMIVVSTWSVMLAVQRRLWGKRVLAVSVMTVALLLIFVAPFSAAIGTLVANADEIAGWVKGLAEVRLPPPPDIVEKIPVVGEKTAALWRDYATKGFAELAQAVAPYAGRVTRWFAAEVGGFGLVSLQFLLTVIVSAILYANGEDAAQWVRRFGRRLAGERGDRVVLLAGQAIRGVAIGVVVTALVQSLLGGIGLVVAGVPFAAVLTAIMFMLALAQIGAVPVLVCALAWLWWKDATAWFFALLVWTVIVGSLDNVLRPILIRKGADLPLLLIFAGVIGGLFAFGLLGLFVGPVILAVSYTLLDAWVAEAPAEKDAVDRG
ncbi:MAG: AI-2E family transporter YdiK [Aquincola sp.]|nr:AI-2E family transporter YdiK [Aquincola sp.]MDH4287717.1 AI-2E family transporter YdiK [Aquincola sp.]